MLTNRKPTRAAAAGMAGESTAGTRVADFWCLRGCASRIALAGAFLAGAQNAAPAADTTISTAAGAQTVTGNDTLTVTGTGTVSGAPAVTWQLGTGGSPGIVVTNAGTITSTGTGRAFDTTGTAAGARSFSLTNAVGGTISGSNDAFRTNGAITSGALSVDNTGLLTSTTNGRALDFRQFTGGTTTIVNRAGANANGGGVIRAVAQDGIGLGGGTIAITNSNVIEAGTGGGSFRAINLSSGTALTVFTLTNNAGARISSTDDAVRIGSAAPSGATIRVDNAGTLLSQTGQAIDFDAAGGTGVSIIINNLAGGTIQSNNQSALRPGQNATVNNAGTVASYGTAGASNDGVDYNGNSAGTFNNLASGTVSGLRHGVNMSAAGGFLTVTNAAGGSITGRNGSGVGLDGAGSVTNAGTITGAYAGTGNGDGDGIDIDFAATIVNSGTVQGTGAGGYDARGRANNSEGISIGGGSVTNSGTISGQGQGIVVNNDSNANNSRSGVAATTITNQAGGTIIGQTGYAIRLENKTGTSADNDTLVNYGTIIGNGTIPDPNGIVLLQNGTADPGSVGTLDGVAYTGTGSARFIRGDGSAIQMGEGDDVLTNYGTIIGNTGRAINMEGGNDTLNLYTGSSIIGRIDGGAGNDTINLRGTGTGTLANVINVEALNVQAGSWSLLDDLAYSSGVTIARGASLQVGTGGTAGSLAANVANDGALSFNRSDTVTFAGAISGTGSLGQIGTGTLVLTGANTYTGATSVASGTLMGGAPNAFSAGSATGIATGGTLDLGGFAQAINAVTLNGGILRNGALTGAVTANGGTIDRLGGAASVTTLAGLTLATGTNTYTGPTRVNGGEFRVLGTVAASDIVVNAGGTLSGTGKIGDPVIGAGGVLAPGTPDTIGTLSIYGPLVFNAGSTYTVKVTPTTNDLVAVAGPVTIQGGTVNVLAGSGTYVPQQRYTILTASGGISGQFSALQTTSNLAFLQPSLTYDRSGVYLGFVQAQALTGAASTDNQTGVASGLQAILPSTNATGTGVATTAAGVIATQVLNQSAAGALQAFNALSGEVQGSAASAVLQTGLVIEGALLDHLRFGAGDGVGGLGGPGLSGGLGSRFAPGTALPAAYSAAGPGEPVIGLVPVRPATPNYALWGQGFGGFGSTAGDGNAARLARRTGGFVLGLESGVGALSNALVPDLRVGVAAGYSFTGFDVAARQSTGQVESGFGAVYARGGLGPVQVRLGAAYAGNALDTRRTVLFPGFSQAVTGRAGGDTVNGFGEVGYRLGDAALSLEPFVGGGALHIRRDGFTEAGGAAALTVYGRGYAVQTATAGLQGRAVLADLFGPGAPVAARGLIGYRRAFGDVVPQALLAFGGGPAFLTAGTPLARDAVLASAGLEAQVAPAASLGLTYTGQLGARAQDHAIQGSFIYRW